MNHLKNIGRRGLALFVALLMCTGMAQMDVNAAGKQKNYKVSKLACAFKGHSWGEYETAVEPTCLVSGISYRVCTKCGARDLLHPKKIAATGHSFGDGRNIVNKGDSDVYHWVQCKNCRYSEMRHHKYSDPTCTSPATCSICGHTKGTAKGHVFDAYVQIGTAKHAQKCAVCGELGEAEAHELTTTVVKVATCTTPGEEKVTCEVCGLSNIKKTPVSSTHNYVDSVCTECGAVDPNHAHQYQTAEEKAPTCVTEGLVTSVCSICGDTKIETVPATGKHTYGEKVAEVPATCTEDGVKGYYKCGQCGEPAFIGTHAITDPAQLVIPAVGHHVYGDKIAEVAATCTKDGVKAHYECVNCRKLFMGTHEVTAEDLVIPATGKHTYGEKVEEIPATCTEDGVKGYYKCGQCGEPAFIGTHAITDPAQLVIPAVGHHVYGDKIAEVAATCTKDGVKAHYECVNCRKLFMGTHEVTAEDLIIPAGHVWSEWNVTQTADDEYPDNIREHFCTVCGTHEKETF